MNQSSFTVLFMMGVTAVFIALLAILNTVTQPRIQINQTVQESKSILYAFGILPEGVEESKIPPTATTTDLPWDETRLLKKIQTALTPVPLPVPDQARTWLSGTMLSPGDTATVYVQYASDDSIRAYGFYLRGKGLWGTIQAFMAVNAGFTRAVGIDFTEQVETPGLGARIAEQEFKSHFRNLNINGVCRFASNGLEMVRNKEVPNRIKSTNQLEAVTGATLTSNGVLNMLESDLRFYYNLVQANQDLLYSQN